jgi:hypothetical protein
MTREVPFTAVEYGDGGKEVVALVTGFAGKVRDVEQAATDLVRTGRDAVVYTYHPRILLDGDPKLLPQMIETLGRDFVQRTPDHLRRRFGGVSLGGAIAAGMQKDYATPERGLLAATGVDAAHLVMENPAFGSMVLAVHHINIRRAYLRNGYSLADLREEWHNVQVPPRTPFTIAVGGLDYIVQQREIMPKLTAWKKENPGIHIIRKPWLGHNGTIKWFNRNIMSMLETEPTTDGTGTDAIEIVQAA